ncbi:hypothetical protein BDF22DRAFT_741502 [Syncephalis plumigaleata]|nr:hypothetical protein BDF22DRAFT_741502 [Syncephalis plumigaleata]
MIQPYPVEVRLQSDLDGQITFQTWTTNTVDATEKSINILGDDSAERQFNLLFNYVNIAGSIRLDAHECRDLVLSFLPTDTPEKISSLHRSSNARDNTPSNDDLSDRDESTDDPASFGDDTNDGARKEAHDKGANESTIADGHAAGSGTGTGSSSGTGNGRRFNGRNRSEHITEISSLEAQTFDQDESFFYHDVQGSIYFLVYPLEQNGIARPAIDTTTAPMDRRISVAPPAFVKSTHVTARVCRSFLWSDISGTVISLPDCMPGETHVKDFTVWNRSEIDLYFRLEATQLGAIPRGVADELTFIDADTGDPIGQRPIPGFGHRRLRATFCPSSVGNYTFDIRLENENDAYNSEEARIQAVVKSLAVSASLIVNEETLDFGVCYSGHGYSRKFVVKNVSELPVEVHLQAQDANVKFYPIAKESISDETAATTPTTSMAATPDLRATSTSMGASRDTGGLLHSDIDLLGLGLSHSSGGNTGGHATSTNTSGNPHSSSNLASSSKTNANSSSAIRSSHMEPIEELIVKPGVERVIMATYTPRPDASSTDYQAGRLLRRTFRIQLSISSSVPGNHTSILNFGDTDVGVLKSLPLVITNYSELPAQVQIRFASKILTCDRQQISIPPKQSQEVKFEIYPRKVNPEYRKQVEIVNLNHRQDNQIVEVKSNNVDRKGVSFHSLFYRVITTVGINYLDFGTVICGAPIIRAMMIDNISGKELALSLSTSDPDHIRLFTVASDEPGNLMSLIDSAPLSPVLHRTNSPTNVDTSRVAQLVSNDSRSTTMTSNHLPAPQPLFASASATNEESRRNVPLIQQPMESMDFLDLALPVISGGKKASRRRRIADQGRRIAGVRPQHQNTTSSDYHHHHQDIANASMSQRRNEMTDAIWNKVLAAERELSMVPPVFASQMAEESYVQEQIALRSQLQAYIDDGLLVPLTNDLVVEAHSKRRLMVWYQPIMPALKTDTTNPRFDTLEHVAIRLVRFNRDAIDTPSEALPVSDNEITIPVRQVLLKARLRQINLEIGQRSINLGPIGKEERRTNVITIRNRGELPLLYALKKSGSALSGDIVFRNGGQSGVVRGFSVREVEFVYQPSLSGDFSEKIIVENVLDPQNNGAVLVKAFVRKSTHFYVKPTEIDLGPCLLGGENTSPVRSALMITNTDYQTRTFVARVEKIEYPGFTGRINFHVERSDDGLDGTGALLSEDAQEKIESLEQKMKIARRKGRSDKVKKLEDKLDRLRRGTPDEPQVGQGLDDDEDELHVEEETDTKASTNPQGGGDESELETPSNDPANEASIRVIKITPESITFSLVGRITEKLWITLDTTLTEEGEGGEQDNSSAIAIEQTLMGTITVHEQKNTDVSQQIAFTAQVFHDAVSESESTTTATAAVTTTGSNQTTMPATPATIRQIHTIHLTNSTDNVKQFYIRYTSSTSTSNLSITWSECNSDEIIQLSAGEKRTFSPSVQANSFGWHYGRLTFSDIDQQWTEMVPLECYAHAERLLHFPALDTTQSESITEGKENQSEKKNDTATTTTTTSSSSNSTVNDKVETLDLGFCYMGSNKYAQIVPLMMSSQTDEELQLSCQSNLSQVLVFLDSHATRPASQVILKPRSIITLWIAVQPSLNVTASRNESRDRDGDIRRLIGGLRFTLTTPVPDQMEVLSLGSQILRFTTTIGRSILSLSQKRIHLGWTHYSMNDSTDNSRSGTLGVEGGDNPPEATVHFRMNSSRYGHLSETISVINVHNPQQVLDLNPVIVVKVIQPDGTKEKQVQRITEMDGDTLPEKSIQLENTTDTPILLSATSELGQAIRWNGPSGVNPVQWIDTPSALERGEQVTISGLLEIRQLNETELDLGQVGYINSWQPIDISCHLRNLSPLPLHYAIEWPEFIVVHPDQEENRLPDKSTGETRYELLIRNLYNPTNTMSLRLTMEMTTFDLRFERLHNDELTMPSLQYPTTTASVPCDSWFKVVNTSAQDIRFDIGTELSTQVDTFIRLDVLSRFSNSPLKGGVSLAANGSIEVRVVASLRPGVRLSSEMRSIIVHQTSIVLGKIWVTTQLALDALETRLTEDIIVRGTIMETCVPLSQLLLIQPPLLEEEDVGSVRPEEQLVLRCWLRPNTSRLPDAIRICVIDMHALTEQSSTLTLRVPAMAKRAIPIPNVVSSTSTSTNTSTTTTTTANTNTTASIPVSSARLTVTTTSTSTNHTSSMLLPSPPKPAPPIVTSSTSSYNVATSRNSVAVTAAPTAVAVNTNNTTTHLASSPSTTTAVSSRLGSPLMSGDDTYPDRLPQQYPVYLTIRGCRRIDEDSNRFELDLGQLSVGSPAIVKSMVLTRNLSMQHTTMIIYPIHFLLYRTRGRLGNTSNSSNSGTGGTGSASGTGNNNSNIATSTSYHDMSGMLLHDEEHNEQTLTITVIPGEISVSTAHIVIESSRDPIHRIMIRVNMDKTESIKIITITTTTFAYLIFSVSTSYLQGGEGLIEMPYVNFNSEYVMRSIMIRNHDAVTLPFTVTADLGSDPSDVVFSTSRTSAKLFSTLYVDGGHTTRVYIRFRPMPSAKALPATNNNNTSDTDENTGPAEQKTIRIYVGCRLVKDYQFAVNLKANCSWPTLSMTRMLWISEARDSGFDISLEAGQDILTVTNLAQHRRATFTLINDSTFFHVEPASECIQLNEQSSTIIVVRPRLEVLKKHMKTIRREKYICEVISLYNVDRPEERHWITLRITLDQSRYVQAIAVTHITLAYEVMEKRIAEFHSLLGKQLRRHVSSQRDVILDNTEQELSLSPPMERIPFAFRYIVDQLSYYCTIKTGGRFFQLACLFFSLLLHPLIQYPEYNEWTEHWQRGLSEFLSIFPETNEKLQDLRRLLDTTPTMTNSLQNTTSNSNTMSNYPITGGLTRAISYNTSRSEETM